MPISKMILSGNKKLVCAGMALLLATSLSLGEDSIPQKTKSAKPVAKSAKVHKSAKKSRTRRVRGQKAIDGNRAREIQEALVREHYMKSEPTGNWDAATQDALRRYQADQGWQSKTVPDSRALIRLGLGPDQEHLLNPESAMTSLPVLRESSDTGVASSAIRSPLPNSTPVSALPAASPAR
jgi:hypothetical protein